MLSYLSDGEAIKHIQRGDYHVQNVQRSRWSPQVQARSDGIRHAPGHAERSRRDREGRRPDDGDQQPSLPELGRQDPEGLAPADDPRSEQQGLSHAGRQPHSAGRGVRLTQSALRCQPPDTNTVGGSSLCFITKIKKEPSRKVTVSESGPIQGRLGNAVGTWCRRPKLGWSTASH